MIYNMKGTIEEMKKLAKSKGGICLSNEYINSRTKLKWKCAQNHIWEATSNNIKNNHWCQICSEGISEKICRRFFEEIFKEKFLKKRYNWLISPKGKKLELDGYNEKLQIAFEYQGQQHYEIIGFVNSQERFKYLQKCDSIKKKQCKFHNIKLIKIPYTIEYDDMEQYIINKCKLNIRFQNLNYRDWDVSHNDRLEKLRELVAIKKGSCLSKKYIDSYSKLKWKCHKKHKWFATANKIQQNRWCPICAHQKMLGNMYASKYNKN